MNRVIRSVKNLLLFSIEEDVYEKIVRIYSKSGVVAAYEELMKHLEKYAENNPISFSHMSMIYIIVNQPDKAMDWIEKEVLLNAQRFIHQPLGSMPINLKPLRC